MKLFTAAYYEFLKNLRDLRMLIVLVVFPIAMIYILGTAIQGYFSDDASKRIVVGLVNKDTGEIGREFDRFLLTKEISDRLTVISLTDYADGQTALDEGRISVLIYLPGELSDAVKKGSPSDISLYGKKNISFVESMVSGFTSSINAANAVISVHGSPVMPEQGGSLKRVDLGKNASAPDAIDYYSVLTLLQTLVAGAIFGIFISARDQGSDIHIRVHSLPVSRWVFMGGRILGSTAYLFLASIITIAFSIVVYNANWHGNPAIILGTVLLFCLISVGIGVLIGIIVPNFPTAMMVVILLMIFFGASSGAISPTSSIDSLALVSPNYHAKVILFGTIYGYSKEVMSTAASWLAGYALIIYAISALLVRRVKYDNI